MARVNPSQVQKLLFGLRYPIGRNQIADHAETAGFNSYVIGIINKLPDKSYDDSGDIAKAIEALK